MGGGVGLRGGGGGQGGCELRSESFVKIKKKMGGGYIGGSGFGGVGGGVQVGCEWRSEAFVKIQKQNFFFLGGGGWGVGSGGSGWGVRVDGTEK